MYVCEHVYIYRLYIYIAYAYVCVCVYAYVSVCMHIYERIHANQIRYTSFYSYTGCKNTL